MPAIDFPSPSRTRTCRFSTWLNWPSTAPGVDRKRSIRSSLRWPGYLSTRHWTVRIILHRLTTVRYSTYLLSSYCTFLSICITMLYIFIVALLIPHPEQSPFSCNLHCLTAKTRARPEAQGGESINGRTNVWANRGPS